MAKAMKMRTKEKGLRLDRMGEASGGGVGSTGAVQLLRAVIGSVESSEADGRIDQSRTGVECELISRCKVATARE